MISRLKRQVRAITRTASIHIEEVPYRQDRALAEVLDGIGQFEKTLGVSIELNGRALQPGSFREPPDSLETNLAFSEQIIAWGDVVEHFEVVVGDQERFVRMLEAWLKWKRCPVSLGKKGW